MNTERFPRRTPEIVVRISAAEVFLLSVAAAVSGFMWIPLFLAGDFALRAFFAPKLSPVGYVARGSARTFGGRMDRLVFSAPKRFAATIGFSLSILAFVLGAAGIANGTRLVMVVLAIFSGLESFAGFCAGCKIYSWLIQMGLISRDNCPDCV